MAFEIRNMELEPWTCPKCQNRNGGFASGDTVEEVKRRWYTCRKCGYVQGSASFVEVLAGAAVLLGIAIALWYFWPNMANWYAGRQARSAADEFLAELAGQRRGESAPRHTFDRDELEAIARKLQFKFFESASWDEVQPNADRTVYDLKGTARSKDQWQTALSLQLAYRDGSWVVQSFDFPALPPDFLREHALSGAERELHEVLTRISRQKLAARAAFGPADEIEKDAVAKMVPALQFYEYQSTRWNERSYQREGQTCSLDGVALLKDGREIPIAASLKRFPARWEVQSLTSSLEQSFMPKDYAVSEATRIASEFLTLVAKSVQPSNLASGVGSVGQFPGGSAAGGGGDATGAAEERYWGSYLSFAHDGPVDSPTAESAVSRRPEGGVGEAEGPMRTGDDVANLFRRLQFWDFQSVRWKEINYNQETMTCDLVATAHLKKEEVPLSLRIGYEPARQSEQQSGWCISALTSPEGNQRK